MNKVPGKFCCLGWCRPLWRFWAQSQGLSQKNNWETTASHEFEPATGGFFSMGDFGGIYGPSRTKWIKQRLI